LYVFQISSGKEVNIGSINFMVKKEFKYFCKDIGLFNQMCGERDADMSFNLAM